MSSIDSPREAPRQYVAMGSSYAAGIGLGQRLKGSARVCQRSGNGYPQQLARLCGLAITDVTCSGATTEHVLRGGQCRQDSQLSAVNRGTELVTLTAGGNDVQYVGDLMMMAYRARSKVLRALMRPFWKAPRPIEDRDFDALFRNLCAIVAEVRARAPSAHVMLVSYPQILPLQGACPVFGSDEGDIELMREVGRRLHATTSEAARTTGATFVDIAAASREHFVGSPEPWVKGLAGKDGAAIHPTLAGAIATAREVCRVLGSEPRRNF
jgi:lysophospholipase L1-like esterase